MDILTEAERQLYEEMKANGEIWSCMIGWNTPINEEGITYYEHREVLKKFDKGVDNE